MTFLTQAEGRIGAVARGARKGGRQTGGALEPFHSLHVVLEEGRGDLASLREARIVRVRAGLLGRLEAAEAAGRALRWGRHLFPARTPEPEAYRILEALLDGLDEGTRPEVTLLAEAALALLVAMGYGLELEVCVRCGRPCPEGKPAAVDAARGGLACQACGGARRVLSPAARKAALDLQKGKGGVDLAEEDARALLALAEEAMAAHADLDGGRA